MHPHLDEATQDRIVEAVCNGIGQTATSVVSK